MNEPKIKPLAILFAVGVGLVIMLFAGWVGAMDGEQMAVDQGAQILAMIGPQGVYAIIGTILLIRTINNFRWFGGLDLLLMNIVIGGGVGAATNYFYLADPTMKQIMAGIVMTPISSIIAYELIKWGLGLAYQTLRWEIIRVAYFFLSPKPLKVKENNKVIRVNPNPTLTQFFDKTRLDK